MDVCLVHSLSKRVAIINVRDLFQHLANLLCEFQVGSCEAYRKLVLVSLIMLVLVDTLARWRTYCRHTSDGADDRRRHRI